MHVSRLLMAASGLALAVSLVACGSGGNDAKSPTTPSTPTPPPTSTINPTPAPPPPTPPPVTGGGTTASCSRLTVGTGTDRNCRQEGGRAYFDALQGAIDSAPADAVEGSEVVWIGGYFGHIIKTCLLYTSPSPRDRTRSRMPSSA